MILTTFGRFFHGPSIPLLISEPKKPSENPYFCQLCFKKHISYETVHSFKVAFTYRHFVSSQKCYLGLVNHSSPYAADFTSVKIAWLRVTSVHEVDAFRERAKL